MKSNMIDVDAEKFKKIIDELGGVPKSQGKYTEVRALYLMWCKGER